MTQTQARDDERDLYREIGAKVRGFRVGAGLSMRALALRAGVSQPFLSQLERGLCAPSISTAYRLADALGITAADLLPHRGVDDVIVVNPEVSALHLPVTDRADTAIGRLMVGQPDRMLTFIDYRIEPGQHITEWFSSEGEMLVYLVSGRLDVELEGHGLRRVAQGELIYYPASVRHRWSRIDDGFVHAVLVIGRVPRPPAGVGAGSETQVDAEPAVRTPELATLA